MGNGAGSKFLKKLMKKVDLFDSLSSFDSRFLSREDKEFLEQIIGSLQKG